jgi:hypothetical protein
MKKTIVRLVVIAGIMTLLSSCITFFFPSTHKLVVDENVPMDLNATVTFKNGFIVKEWNNINIKDDLYGTKNVWSNDITRLTVPAGNTSFTFDLTFVISGANSTTTYSMKNIELRYNLEEEKKYQIEAKTKSLGFLKGYDFFVVINDVTGPSTLLKEWKVGTTG